MKNLLIVLFVLCTLCAYSQSIPWKSTKAEVRKHIQDQEDTYIGKEYLNIIYAYYYNEDGSITAYIFDEKTNLFYHQSYIFVDYGESTDRMHTYCTKMMSDDELMWKRIHNPAPFVPSYLTDDCYKILDREDYMDEENVRYGYNILYKCSDGFYCNVLGILDATIWLEVDLEKKYNKKPAKNY